MLGLQGTNEFCKICIDLENWNIFLVNACRDDVQNFWLLEIIGKKKWLMEIEKLSIVSLLKYVKYVDERGKFKMRNF